MNRGTHRTNVKGRVYGEGPPLCELSLSLSLCGFIYSPRRTVNVETMVSLPSRISTFLSVMTVQMTCAEFASITTAQLDLTDLAVVCFWFEAS